MKQIIFTICLILFALPVWGSVGDVYYCELVFEVQSDFIDEAKTQISNLMSSCFIIDVPLIVDIGVGDNWDKAH